MDNAPLRNEEIARRVRIRGRVHGVSFRAWTVEMARALGLKGWVRNRLDGTVEVLAVGPAEAVEELVRRCHDGPGLAEVVRVEVESAVGITSDVFVQKPTV